MLCLVSSLAKPVQVCNVHLPSAALLLRPPTRGPPCHAPHSQAVVAGAHEQSMAAAEEASKALHSGGVPKDTPGMGDAVGTCLLLGLPACCPCCGCWSLHQQTMPLVWHAQSCQGECCCRIIALLQR